jgi:hypothetical protein
MTIAIRNVGPGVAFAVDVKLGFIPKAEGAALERRWRANILESGAQADFFPPGDMNDNLNGLTTLFRGIRLSGTMNDAEGVQHVVDDEVIDLADWRAALHDAKQRYVPPDSERRLAEAFEGPIEDIAKKLGPKIDNLTRAIYALRPPSGGDET